jgi:hypothetical protein
MYSLIINVKTGFIIMRDKIMIIFSKIEDMFINFFFSVVLCILDIIEEFNLQRFFKK